MNDTQLSTTSFPVDDPASTAPEVVPSSGKEAITETEKEVVLEPGIEVLKSENLPEAIDEDGGKEV